MKSTLRIALTLCACGALAACGGDDKTDAGDAASDAPSLIDLGNGDMAAPTDMGGMDAGMDSGSALTMCDPTATTNPCPTGEHCAITLHLSPVDGGAATVGYGECVPIPPTHLLEGSTCSNWTGTVPGHADIEADPCGEGLFCWNEPTSSVRRCHRLCDDTMAGCNTGEYCLGLNDTPYFGTCTRANNCDPLAQTGCRSTQGCYIVGGTNGDVYASCFDFGAPDGGTGAVGEPCMFIGECQPGEQCLGDMLADGGVSTTRNCKSFCNPSPDGGVDAGDVDAGDVDAGDVDAGDVDAGDVDAGDVDAGDVDAGDVDAGIADAGPADMGRPVPTCTTGMTCMPFEPGADASVSVSVPIGYCTP